MKISVIIPVLNEAERINETVDAVFRQQREIFELIIVDGDKDFSTLKVLKEKRVKCIASPPGRGIQMNMGAAAAEGEILLFLHADTILPENAVSAVRNLMKDLSVSAGAFDLLINSPQKAFRIIEKTASIRSRITSLPFGDQAVFIRKEIFNLLGGYNRNSILEDLDLMRRIKKKGLKIGFIVPGVLTSARRWEDEGIIYCTLRNWLVLVLYFSGFPAKRLEFLFNKRIRIRDLPFSVQK